MTNLVKLFNIILIDNVITCDYAPEDSDKIGKVSVDVNTLEIVDIVYSEYEFGKKTYVAHVRSKLSELLDSKQPIPKETYAIWY